MFFGCRYIERYQCNRWWPRRPDMLRRLQLDHKNISVLLNILAAQSGQLATGGAVNYRVMMDVLDYMQSYAEHSHHPVEDIVYRRLAAQASLNDLSERLFEEHKQLTRITEAFHTTLNLVLNDNPVPIDRLKEELENYISMQRSHMRYEEEIIFPLLKQYLVEADWECLADECQQQLTDDPLFSDNIKRDCQELRSLIKGSEFVD
ncbi:hemerythrin domain-containing protein [Shewanella sp. GXUN23E]|uniref:hemerythrin domain-containing protein n=1 Tax=Shewanella sp. GXUN23E TaxID=3422498 RepID=UPI003D7C8B7C